MFRDMCTTSAFHQVNSILSTLQAPSDSLDQPSANSPHSFFDLNQGCQCIVAARFCFWCFWVLGVGGEKGVVEESHQSQDHVSSMKF